MAIRLLITGGVAGGASAAARARRVDESAEIILFERGEYISFANCGLPYYIGNEIKERGDLLVATPKLLKDRFRIDVRTFSEIISIDREKKQVGVMDHSKGEKYIERYDKLILSPGAGPVRPPLPGIDLDTIYTLRNLPDTDRIKAHVAGRNPESAVIVGGGFIGLEMAENLTAAGLSVTIVEMLDQVMAPLDFEMAAILQEHLRSNGVDLRLKKAVKGFRKDGEKTIVDIGGSESISCDMVILSIGVKPEVDLAKKSGLELGPRGGIKADEYLRTSDADILAIGDAVEVRDYISGQPVLIPLAGPANKQGRIAADVALGRTRAYRGTQGTAIVGVFGLAVASTGASEKTLKRNNMPYLVSHVHPASHATYYPGASQMAFKLIFSPGEGKALGAQIVGFDGVDKRIDVVATAIRAGMTVFDLEELELAYAPQYGSAKDAVNIAGFAAANILRGDVSAAAWDQAETLDAGECAFLDVRNKPEIEATSLIRNAAHIPLHELRGRLGELDKSKTHVVYCAVGLRGYVAARILAQNGFKALNLSGGFKTYIAPTRERRRMESPPEDGGGEKKRT